MGDFVNRTLREIERRMEELRPVVKEYERLAAAEKELTQKREGVRVESGARSRDCRYDGRH